MIASIDHKFVFFANPKSGTSAIEAAFKPFCEIALGRPDAPPWKHINYFRLTALFGDSFERAGCSFYTVVRDPIDTLVSWYRYRSRAELLDPRHRNHQNYCGDLSFEAFAAEWAEARTGRARVSVSVDFCFDQNDNLAPSTYYPYARLEELRQRLCAHVGRDVPLERRNVSPETTLKTRLKGMLRGRKVVAQPLIVDREALMRLSKMRRAYDRLARIPFAPSQPQGVAQAA